MSSQNTLPTYDELCRAFCALAIDYEYFKYAWEDEYGPATQTLPETVENVIERLKMSGKWRTDIEPRKT